MPTRPIDRRINLIARTKKRHQLRAWLASVAVGCSVGIASTAVADGRLQLRPPMNHGAENSQSDWTKRALPQTSEKVAAESKPEQSKPAAKNASVAKPNAVTGAATSSKETAAPALPAGKPIQATPVAGPLDRFRSPLTQLPSMKRTTKSESPDGWQDRNAMTQRRTNESDLPEQSETATSQSEIIPQPATSQPATSQPATSQPASAKPAPSKPLQSGPARMETAQTGTAQTETTRIEPTRIEPTRIEPVQPQSVESDGFRPSAVEGNWIARDAINRVSPLRDPGFQPRGEQQTMPPTTAQGTIHPEPEAFSPKTPTPETARPEAARPETARPQAVLEQDVREVAPRLTKPEAATRNATNDSFLPRGAATNRVGGSMSLREAKTAAKPIAKEQVVVESSAKKLADTKPADKKPAGKLETPVADVDSTAPEKASEVGESVPKQTEPVATRSARPSAEASPQGTAAADAKSSKQQLPKRKPLQNLVDAETTSSKKRADAGAQRDVKPSVAASTPQGSATVGDLGPDELATLDYTGHPTDGVRLTRTVANMRRGMERTLSYFYNRPEVASGRSNWGMMHSLMVFGADTQLIVGRKKYSAIAWIAGNNNCRGQRLLTHDSEGVRAKSGVGLQGHQGQFLAVLGMCNVPVEYPLYAGQVKYSIADLIESEKRACKRGTELTFTLIGLSHYLDTDSTWMADDGTEWSFERLIEEELKQPIVGAACGGTHRLMGYAHALRKRRAEGKPITGQWKRAETYTQDFVNYAYSLQNRDGSMSTKWFEGRADNDDVDRKIQTTGHMVEWLLTVTPDDQLQNRRLVAAVSFLLRSVGSELDRDWSIGPKGHALRSLSMYHQRVFKAGTPWIPTSVARNGSSSNRTR